MEDCLEEALRHLLDEQPPVSNGELQREAEALADTYGVSRDALKRILQRLMSEYR